MLPRSLWEGPWKKEEEGSVGLDGWMDGWEGRVRVTLSSHPWKKEEEGGRRVGSAWMDGWMDGWMVGEGSVGLDGWMDGWEGRARVTLSNRGAP
jgi:hypothetical protein